MSKLKPSFTNGKYNLNLESENLFDKSFTLVLFVVVFKFSILFLSNFEIIMSKKSNYSHFSVGNLRTSKHKSN